MPRAIYIPQMVKDEIKSHLNSAVPKAVAGFLSANEDEDTLTGELGGALRSGLRQVVVPESILEVPATWTWEITYYKFRGRGPRAPESFLGADGIFELSVAIGERREQKSLLFQAKVAGHGNRDLLEQALKLSTWREASTIIEYSESGIRAVPLDIAISSVGAVQAGEGQPLSEYLGDEFLDCRVGNTDLRYEARRRRLIWRTLNGETVATRFAIGHRISIRVDAPELDATAHEVEPEKAHEYRMETDDAQLLGLYDSATLQDVNNARRILARIYHPDKFGGLDKMLQDTANRRMREFNAAADRLKGK